MANVFSLACFWARFISGAMALKSDKLYNLLQAEYFIWYGESMVASKTSCVVIACFACGKNGVWVCERGAHEKKS